MGKVYTPEEKQSYVDAYKSAGLSINKFSEIHDLPESTLRGWLKLDDELPLGIISLSNDNPIRKNNISFSCDGIKIELKEGYNKTFFKSIIEVLLND